MKQQYIFKWIVWAAFGLTACGRVPHKPQNQSGLASLSGDVFCNGRPVRDHRGAYYPNGQIVSDSWGIYYPNGRKIFDSWGLYYDNGKKIHDTWGTYYADGNKIFDSWGVYYPNRQKVKDSWGCYFANGQRMGSCPEQVSVSYMTPDSGALLEHTVRVDSGTIGDIQAQWFMSDGTRMLMTVALDLINDEAQVKHIQAICQ